ncbi:hypothetical protein [Pararhodospirillum photometricum]|uniref:hypothetical protein n=1 Tax=Pararhodospirillum photometricum TaxID=1084 RepID=UPI0002D6CE08|nr:hypothetical protein [Pararhodospirillum photometricum]
MAQLDKRTLDLFADWTPPRVAVGGEVVRAHPDVDARVSLAVAQTLRDCGRPRDEVAAAMAAYLGRPVPVATLNNYASAGQEGHCISLARAVALVAATHDPRPLADELAPLGWAVVETRHLHAVRASLARQRAAELTRLARQEEALWRTVS